jgi:hypothetical protein
MNKLQKIWQTSSAKSVCQSEEEDVGNTSLADSSSTKSSFHSVERKGLLDYSMNELDISEEEVQVPDTPGKQGQVATMHKSIATVTVNLCSAIRTTEVATRAREAIVQRVVNMQKGYIDVKQFAHMIAQAYLADSSPELDKPKTLPLYSERSSLFPYGAQYPRPAHH